ncbi:DUF3592 domain-containing protein [Nitratireductor aquibiodomus]|uniref:DUF3592 domain-containing protein n=1 Tax=Nitratireductor aquibiodomus TaxID=204799 RepID=UPI00046AD185|nr:DUF3592 domain-containing protein [Nitratireductor aquibiodomus]
MFIFLPTWGWWLLQTRNGKREASWRIWFLIFLLPVGFFCASAYLACITLIFVGNAERTTGEVTRVYEWEDTTPWSESKMTYSPVFRYQISDGSLIEASTGQSSPNWDFEVGSIHEILYLPDRKADVKLDNFEALWALPSMIAGITLPALLPSFLGAMLLLRWLRGGTQTVPSRNNG